MSLDQMFDQSAASRMKAVRIGEDHTIGVVETTVPTLGEDDILVKPVACGICGTDLHFLKQGLPLARYPLVPGHEFAGHVVAVGRSVKGLREGDFVAVDPNVVCGHCRWCRLGRPNLCIHLSPIGTSQAGAAADYVASPARNAFKVRESIGHGAAALIEPLACALHAVETARSVKDKRILILGSGTMGLLIAIACQKHGAAEITLADPAEAKHAIAHRAGFESVRDPGGLGNELFDIVFEAAGVAPALKQGLRSLDKLGMLIQVGVHDTDETVPVNPFLVYEQESTIVGSNSCAGQFEAAVDLMTDVHARAETLIGTTFSVWDFADALRSMEKGHDVKTLLRYE